MESTGGVDDDDDDYSVFPVNPLVSHELWKFNSLNKLQALPPPWNTNLFSKSMNFLLWHVKMSEIYSSNPKQTLEADLICFPSSHSPPASDPKISFGKTFRRTSQFRKRRQISAGSQGESGVEAFYDGWSLTEVVTCWFPHRQLK